MSRELTNEEQPFNPLSPDLLGRDFSRLPYIHDQVTAYDFIEPITTRPVRGRRALYLRGLAVLAFAGTVLGIAGSRVDANANSATPNPNCVGTYEWECDTFDYHGISRTLHIINGTDARYPNPTNNAGVATIEDTLEGNPPISWQADARLSGLGPTEIMIVERFGVNTNIDKVTIIRWKLNGNTMVNKEIELRSLADPLAYDGTLLENCSSPEVKTYNKGNKFVDVGVSSVRVGWVKPSGDLEVTVSSFDSNSNPTGCVIEPQPPTNTPTVTEPTATFTLTPTATSTSVENPTATFTATVFATETPTPTSTSTEIPTATPTGAATETPTLELTKTPTPEATLTPTPTLKPVVCKSSPKVSLKVKVLDKARNIVQVIASFIAGKNCKTESASLSYPDRASAALEGENPKTNEIIDYDDNDNNSKTYTIWGRNNNRDSRKNSASKSTTVKLN